MSLEQSVSADHPRTAISKPLSSKRCSAPARTSTSSPTPTSPWLTSSISAAGPRRAPADRPAGRGEGARYRLWHRRSGAVLRGRVRLAGRGHRTHRGICSEVAPALSQRVGMAGRRHSGRRAPPPCLSPAPRLTAPTLHVGMNISTPRKAVFTEVCRVLKPDGIFGISCCHAHERRCLRLPGAVVVGTGDQPHRHGGRLQGGAMRRPDSR